MSENLNQEATIITKATPSIKRTEKLAIEIRDLINDFQKRENNSKSREVVTSILQNASPFILDYINESVEKCEDVNEFFYVSILDNYLEMAADNMEDYWDVME